MTPASSRPPSLPGPGALLLASLRAVVAHPREVGVFVGLAWVSTVGMLVASLPLGGGCGLAIAIGEDMQSELLIVLPVALAMVGLVFAGGASQVVYVGFWRAVSRRMDGGPPVGFFDSLRLCWPRMGLVLLVVSFTLPLILLGLVSLLVPGILLFSVYAAFELAVIIHGLSVRDAAALVLAHFAQNPIWHLKVGAVGASSCLVLVLLGFIENALVQYLVAAVGPLFTLPLYYFWLHAYKAAFGSGRAPRWPG